MKLTSPKIISLLPIVALLLIIIAIVNPAYAAKSMAANEEIYNDNKTLYSDISLAKKNINIAIYTLFATNPRLRFSHYDYVRQIQYSLSQAKKRGVSVELLLNNFNSSSRKIDHIMQSREQYWCRKNNINCTFSSAKFEHSHQKIIIIDNSTAYILTGNLPWCWHTTNCAVNYMYRTTDKAVISYLNLLIKQDKNNARKHSMITPSLTLNNLVISPINSSDKVSEFIVSAKRSLKITQPFLGDNDHIPLAIINALKIALKNKVTIDLITSIPSSEKHWHINHQLAYLNKKYSNFRIHALNQAQFVHAKTIIKDNDSALLGSVNWSNESFYKNREVSIITSNKKIITYLSTRYKHLVSS